MTVDGDDGFGPRPPAVALWRGGPGAADRFRRSLPIEPVARLIERVRSIDDDRPVESLTAAELPLGPLRSFVDRLASDLRSGPGLAIVDGFPAGDLSVAENERFLWAIGLAIGRPVSQSVMGERLGHVRDVTRTDPNARAYRNRSELTPHTDPADLLTFLCLQPAAVGGVSRFVSALTLHEELRRSRPDLLTRLHRGYRYHRLGEHRPGSDPITAHRVPVFSVRDGLISCRYVRQYLEVAAAEDPDIVLDALDREAVEVFESLAADPALHVEFTLAAGEAVFANNFTVLHARSGFEDPVGGPARHLLRLWLATEPPRPVVDHILHYDGEPGIPPVAGRTPSYETDVDVQ